jgi:regulatory protein
MAARPDEHPSITVRRAAMNLLARREQSFFELKQKLTLKYPDLDVEEVIAPALEKLKAENLQSDERFVESYVRYRYSRGVGPLKIAMELGQKGLKGQLVKAEVYSADIDWPALCLEAMNKRFGPEPVQTLADKEKRYRFLAQRGFETDHIRQVLG